MRRKIVAGNWKMHMLPNEAIQFIQELEPRVKDTNQEVIVCVPYTDIFYTVLNAQGTNIKIGAQNMHWEETGAFTGEVSAPMLKAVGIDYVIIGHSERRAYFAETDETVNKKIQAALHCGLIPIVCVGESLEQREKGETKTIITNQVCKALEGVSPEWVRKILFAYEPIWAIGTGKTATKEQANETILGIRNQIASQFSEEIAQEVSILYGGSVKANNAKDLFSMPEIDGALVGGASLKAEEFVAIVNFDK